MSVLCLLNVCDRNDSQLTDVLGRLSINHTVWMNMACMIIFCDLTVKTGDRGRILILGPLCRCYQIV